MRMHTIQTLRPSYWLEADGANGFLPKSGAVSAVLRQWLEEKRRASPLKAAGPTRVDQALIDYWELKTADLQSLAISRGIKREGESWKACVGGMGNRANIIGALRRFDELEAARCLANLSPSAPAAGPPKSPKKLAAASKVRPLRAGDSPLKLRLPRSLWRPSPVREMATSNAGADTASGSRPEVAPLGTSRARLAGWTAAAEGTAAEVAPLGTSKAQLAGWTVAAEADAEPNAEVKLLANLHLVSAYARDVTAQLDSLQAHLWSHAQPSGARKPRGPAPVFQTRPTNRPTKAAMQAASADEASVEDAVEVAVGLLAKAAAAVTVTPTAANTPAKPAGIQPLAIDNGTQRAAGKAATVGDGVGATPSVRAEALSPITPPVDSQLSRRAVPVDTSSPVHSMVLSSGEPSPTFPSSHPSPVFPSSRPSPVFPQTCLDWAAVDEASIVPLASAVQEQRLRAPPVTPLRRFRILSTPTPARAPSSSVPPSTAKSYWHSDRPPKYALEPTAGDSPERGLDGPVFADRETLIHGYQTVSSPELGQREEPALTKLPRGTQLQVWWSGCSEAYECTVVGGHSAQNLSTGLTTYLHRCEYEGGTFEHDLSEVAFEPLVVERPPSTLKKERRPWLGRKAATPGHIRARLDNKLGKHGSPHVAKRFQARNGLVPRAASSPPLSESLFNTMPTCDEPPIPTTLFAISLNCSPSTEGGTPSVIDSDRRHILAALEGATPSVIDSDRSMRI